MSEAFLQYRELMLKLHSFERTHQLASLEADRLYEEMDDLWDKMSEEEHTAVRQMTANLYRSDKK